MLFRSLAVDDERMQIGHFNGVQATPLTKVDLAASLTFLHVARGHCSMNEVGVGDRCPVPSEQEVSFCNLRASFSAKAVARIDCSGSSQGQFWGSRKEEGMEFPFLNFLPGPFQCEEFVVHDNGGIGIEAQDNLHTRDATVDAVVL